MHDANTGFTKVVGDEAAIIIFIKMQYAYLNAIFPFLTLIAV